jgi:hypothetical protein
MKTTGNVPRQGGLSPKGFLGALASGRASRRGFVFLLGFAALLAVLYNEENWRGKRAWQQLRREAELRGETLDWSAYVPPPVPDEQNFFKAPKMQEWFANKAPGGQFSNELSGRLDAALVAAKRELRATLTNRVLVATLFAGPSTNGTDPPADAVWTPGDGRARKLISDAFGPMSSGAGGTALTARPFAVDKVSKIGLEATTPLTAKTIRELFLTNVAGLDSVGGSRLHLEPFDDGFELWLSPGTVLAADYLSATDAVTNDFALVREAVKRPSARIDGDYERPFETDAPNFVVLRRVAQILADRTRSFLLLGQPEKAWEELTLMHDFCRVLEARPSGHPMSRVATMIRAALAGMYVNTFAEGLHLRTWREPQLAAIQNQLSEVKLLPLLSGSVEWERAAFCHTLEATPSGQLADVLSFSAPKKNLWERVKNPETYVLGMMPRGWILQNAAIYSELQSKASDSLDLHGGLILPREAAERATELENLIKHPSPYNILACIAYPEWSRALLNVAHNQTKLSEGMVVCALERHRLAHGEYPETLNELVPALLEDLPHDVIGGRPLNYHRTKAGGFVLYSVGWNQTDDGGVPGKSLTEGDWVWESPKEGR